MNNITAGAINLHRALEIARSMFPVFSEDTLIAILYGETRYPFETNEIALAADLREYKLFLIQREMEGASDE